MEIAELTESIMKYISNQSHLSEPLWCVRVPPLKEGKGDVVVIWIYTNLLVDQHDKLCEAVRSCIDGILNISLPEPVAGFMIRFARRDSDGNTLQFGRAYIDKNSLNIARELFSDTLLVDHPGVYCTLYS